MQQDEKIARLAALEEEYKDCQRCPALACPSKGERHNVVLGAGNPNASLMLIGESPDATEDKEGSPFCGTANAVLGQALNFYKVDSNDLWLTYATSCRARSDSGHNREPTSQELQNCLPRLHREIELVDPFVILIMGRASLKALVKGKTGINALAEDSKIPRLEVRSRGQCDTVLRPGYATYSPRWVARPDNAQWVEGSPLHRFFQAFEKVLTLADRYEQTMLGKPLVDRPSINDE